MNRVWNVGKEMRENGDSRDIEAKQVKGVGRASSTWSRLIQRIFEAYPVLDTGESRFLKLFWIPATAPDHDPGLVGKTAVRS